MVLIPIRRTHWVKTSWWGIMVLNIFIIGFTTVSSKSDRHVHRLLCFGNALLQIVTWIKPGAPVFHSFSILRKCHCYMFLVVYNRGDMCFLHSWQGGSLCNTCVYIYTSILYHLQWAYAVCIYIIMCVWHTGLFKITAIHMKPQRYLAYPAYPQVQSCDRKCRASSTEMVVFLEGRQTQNSEDNIELGDGGTWPLWCGTSWDGCFLEPCMESHTHLTWKY